MEGSPMKVNMLQNLRACRIKSAKTGLVKIFYKSFKINDAQRNTEQFAWCFFWGFLSQRWTAGESKHIAVLLHPLKLVGHTSIMRNSAIA